MSKSRYLFTVIFIVILLINEYECYSQSNVRNHLSKSVFELYAKSRMPVFDQNDEEELANIMSGNNQQRLVKKPVALVVMKQQPPLQQKPPPQHQKQPQQVQPSLQQLQQKVNRQPAPKAKAPSAYPPRMYEDYDTYDYNSYSQSITAVSTPNSITQQPQPKSIPTPPVVLPPLVKPNNDWRSAKSDANPYQPVLYNAKKPPMAPKSSGGSGGGSNDHDDYFSFTDLDYDDFEMAMREEENGDMGVKADKVSAPVIIHTGLHSGDMIPLSLFSNTLLQTDGSKCEVIKLIRPSSDLLFVFADPRRMTDEFKAILRQFTQIPLNPLKVSLAAINCDECVDQRKFLKKANGIPLSAGLPSYTLLSDPTRKFMSSVKCRADGRLTSSLMLLEASAGLVLKIWYEDSAYHSWDPMETKDLIVEEVTAYRRNPQNYIQSQIGIR